MEITDSKILNFSNKMNFKKGLLGGGFLMISNPNKQLLLVKRSSNADYEPNKWFFLGGTIEKDECPIITTVREVYEEGKLLPNQYDIINNYFHLQKSFDSSKNKLYNVHIFGAKAKPNLEVVLNDEHVDYDWVNLEDCKKLDLFNTLKTMLYSESIKNKIISLL